MLNVSQCLAVTLFSNNLKVKLMSLISQLTELTNNNESFCSHVYAVLIFLGLLSVLDCNRVRVITISEC